MPVADDRGVGSKYNPQAMILVTGAGGKTGREVVQALVARAAPVRALVHRREQVEAVRCLGVKETEVGDLLDTEDMLRAMQDVRAVYLIAPNVHPEESRIGETAIAAARRVGVARLVYHSVLHPQTREMPHHWQKLEVEEKLFEAGLKPTILQPAPYMQNILPYWDVVRAEGVYRVPYGSNAGLSLVDLDDVAQAAAAVLLSPGHEHAIYELCGPEVLHPQDIADQMGEELARSVAVESVPISDWIEQARNLGLTDYSVEALARMFSYYDRFGLRGNPWALEELLGRRPATFRQFVARTCQSPLA
jgi:NAD(P)H dehydrogenase (quinone)